MIRLLIFIPVLLVILFLLGSQIQKVLKQNASVSRALCFGFVGCMALFQYIAFPLYQLNCSFTMLFWCFTIPAAAWLLWSCWNLLKGGAIAYKESLLGSVRALKEDLVLTLALVAAIGVMLLFSQCFGYCSSDDGFYIPRAAMVVQENRLSFSSTQVWLGQMDASYPKDSDASSLEFFKAYLSYCSGIDVATVCRTGLNVVLSAISLLAFWNLAGDLAGNRPEKHRIQCFTLIFYCMLSVLGSVHNDSAVFWTVRYIWQGKALICGVIFPMLMSGCVRILDHGKEDIPAVCWVQTGLILTAGVAVSIVGAFLPFLCYFCLGFPFLIYRGWKKGAALIGPIILSCISVILFAGLILLEVNTENSQYYDFFWIPDWFATFSKCLGVGCFCYLALYLLSLLGMLRHGRLTEKLLLCAAPAVLFLTFLNPLLVEPVARYITTSSVYWRLYWIIPLWFLPAYMAGRLLALVDRRKMKIIITTAIATIGICILMFGGMIWPQRLHHVLFSYLVQWTDYPRREYLSGLPRDVVEIGETILEDYSGEDHPRVMMTPYSIKTSQLRQYSIDIHLVSGIRPGQLKNLPQTVPSGEETLGSFLDRFYTGEETDSQALKEVLEMTRTDYVCLPRDTQHPLMTECGWSILATIDEWDVWKPTSID